MVIVLDIHHRFSHVSLFTVSRSDFFDILIEIRQQLFQGPEIVVKMAEVRHVPHFAVKLKHIHGGFTVNPEHLIQHLFVHMLTNGLKVGDIDLKQLVNPENLLEQRPHLFLPICAQYIAKLADRFLWYRVNQPFPIQFLVPDHPGIRINKRIFQRFAGLTVTTDQIREQAAFPADTNQHPVEFALCSQERHLRKLTLRSPDKDHLPLSIQQGSIKCTVHTFKHMQDERLQILLLHAAAILIFACQYRDRKRQDILVKADFGAPFPDLVLRNFLLQQQFLQTHRLNLKPVALRHSQLLGHL
ncbi:hypothetical protein D3C77_361750 [compost metagenome]